MSDYRDIDGFPLHIDEMVRNPYAGIQAFDYAKEWEENKRIADIEIKAIMGAGIGEAMYQMRIDESRKWQEDIAVQKEKMRK